MAIQLMAAESNLMGFIMKAIMLLLTARLFAAVSARARFIAFGKYFIPGLRDNCTPTGSDRNRRRTSQPARRHGHAV